MADDMIDSVAELLVDIRIETRDVDVIRDVAEALVDLGLLENKN